MQQPPLQTVSLRLIIEKPLAGLLYALQQGSGSGYETVQTQQSEGGDLSFYLSLPVRRDKAGELTFAGPLVQGPPGERFLYVNLGSYAGQGGPVHSGRLKVPLPVLTDDLLKEAQQGQVLQGRIPGTNVKNGRPTMASVQLIGGWVV